MRRRLSLSGVVLVLAAGLLVPVSAAPAAAQVPTVDYDVDDDGLIEVSSLARLNAIRWDLDGDGTADVYPADSRGNTGHDPQGAAKYAAAFPNAAAQMGCPSSGCDGYELSADLDFDTNASGTADAGDEYWNGGKGWVPLMGGEAIYDGRAHNRLGDQTWGKNFGQRPHSRARMFTGTFEGNGRTIANLFIEDPSRFNVGLFGYVGPGAHVRNVGLTAPNSDSRVRGAEHVGALAGEVEGARVSGVYSHVDVTGRRTVGGLAGASWRHAFIIESYATGDVAGVGGVGGLVGMLNYAGAAASYATGDVTVTGCYGGGLAGYRPGGHVRATYATGSVTNTSAGCTIQIGNHQTLTRLFVGGLIGSLSHAQLSQWMRASYAIGQVSGSPSVAGGLAGDCESTRNPRDDGSSYWDVEASGLATSFGCGVGYTTAQLQAPTGYTGIYADWNVDVDVGGYYGAFDGPGDDPWDFGTSSQYPVLKYCAAKPGIETADGAPYCPLQPANQGRSLTVTLEDSDVGDQDADVDADGKGADSEQQPADVDPPLPETVLGVCSGGLPSVLVGDVAASRSDVSVEFEIGLGCRPSGTVSVYYAVVREGSISGGVKVARLTADEPTVAVTVGVGSTRSLGLEVVYATGAKYPAEGVVVFSAEDAVVVAPPPVVSVVGVGDVVEGSAASFTVSASSPPAADLAVGVAVAASGDFGVAAETRTVTIPKGAASATLAVATADDSVDELDGSVTVTLKAGGDGYTVSGSAATASVGVADDDVPPPVVAEVSIAAGGDVVEGGNAVFTLSASPTPNADVDVDVSVSAAGEWGVAGGSRTVRFAAGAATATLMVATADDEVDEADGSVSVALDAPGADAGYTVSSSAGSAAVGVADDDVDPLTVYMMFFSRSIEEHGAGYDNQAQLNIGLTRTLRAWETLSVPLSVTGGEEGTHWVMRDLGDADAVFADDFEVTLGPGDQLVELVLTAVADSDWVDEEITVSYGTAGRAPKLNGSTEGVVLGVSWGPDGVERADGSTTVVIVDGDDPPPRVDIISAAGGTEGTAATFTIASSAPVAADLDISVDIASSGEWGATVGTATVTIPKGATQATLTVGTVDDSVDEADGSITVTVAAGSGYTVGPQATRAVQILDDDDPPPEPVVAACAGRPTVSVADATAARGDDLEFVISLSCRAAHDVTVYYFVVRGGAYSAGARATIAGGGTHTTVSVPTAGTNSTLGLHILYTIGAANSTAKATSTITD